MFRFSPTMCFCFLLKLSSTEFGFGFSFDNKIAVLKVFGLPITAVE
jgi:hypothetical protein